MFDVVWQRLDSGLRLSLPFLTVFLCTLVGVIAWPLPYLGTVAPPLTIMAIYYWTLHRPDLFRPGMAFLIGLLNDVLNSLPLGLSALLFVGLHQLILRQRRFFAGHSFFTVWWGFILIVSTTMFVEWVGLCLLQWQVLPVMPIAAQVILAIVFFPLPCWLFIRLQRAALSQS
jgi:rod shape-determining protein MreD